MELSEQSLRTSLVEQRHFVELNQLAESLVLLAQLRPLQTLEQTLEFGVAAAILPEKLLGNMLQIPKRGQLLRQIVLLKPVRNSQVDLLLRTFLGGHQCFVALRLPRTLHLAAQLASDLISVFAQLGLGVQSPPRHFLTLQLSPQSFVLFF